METNNTELFESLKQERSPLSIEQLKSRVAAAGSLGTSSAAAPSRRSFQRLALLSAPAIVAGGLLTYYALTQNGPNVTSESRTETAIAGSSIQRDGSNVRRGESIVLSHVTTSPSIVSGMTASSKDAQASSIERSVANHEPVSSVHTNAASLPMRALESKSTTRVQSTSTQSVTTERSGNEYATRDQSETKQPPVNGPLAMNAEATKVNQRNDGPVSTVMAVPSVTEVDMNASTNVIAETNANALQGEGISPLNRHADSWKVGVSLQSGIVMGSLNTVGSGASITVAHNWQQLSVRYTTTFGMRTSDVIRTLPATQSGWQNVRDIAMMAGARLEQGNFWASLEAGPNFSTAEFGNVVVLNGSPDTTNWTSLSGLGASAQATFAFRATDNLGFSVTGYATNHTITYGGILFSVVIGKLE